MNEKDDDITHLGIVSEPEKRVISHNSVSRHGQFARLHNPATLSQPVAAGILVAGQQPNSLALPDWLPGRDARIAQPPTPEPTVREARAVT